jgi:4-oxalocrotonate tautomerase
MPHVIVKLWPGKSETQKQALADDVTAAVMKNLGSGAASVSVSLEEVEPGAWTENVVDPDIINGSGKLYKEPGYLSLYPGAFGACARNWL